MASVRRTTARGRRPLALTVLNSLYSYLGDGGHLDINPFALVKRKVPRPKKKSEKNLDLTTWELFLRILTNCYGQRDLQLAFCPLQLDFLYFRRKDKAQLKNLQLLTNCILPTFYPINKCTRLQ